MIIVAIVIAAVVGIIVRDGRVLAMRRAPAKGAAGAGRWETLSGRIEEGEEPLDAIRREIVEEARIEVELEARPLTAYIATRGNEPMICIVYRALWRAGEVTRSSEHDEHAWLTVDELALRPTFPKLVDAVRLALR